jgi:anhydro-N-acetylmuramic acid kinase
MTRLTDIIRKNNRIVVGVLSGTSVDAVDIVLTRISGNSTKTRIKILGYKEYRIPSQLRNNVLNVSQADTGTVDEVCKLNVILGRFYSECILSALKSFGILPRMVDLIGSHGQTIHHLPQKNKMFGFYSNSTLQIGDPSVIAVCTGITTVGDFRIADIGAGGSGAPLVPYLDYLLFADKIKNRILLNIGGISNITVLPAGTKFGSVIAFDTGPGNMMIDYISKKFFGKNFDRNSKLALKGTINNELFIEIKNADKFYSKKPPKSTGREFYSIQFIENILKKFRKISKYDTIRTFTEYTAFTIAYNIGKFSGFKDNFDLIMSGGGASNPLLVTTLKNNVFNAKIEKIGLYGINANNKEAVLFAVLANESVSGIPANMMKVTGSKLKVILGKICQAV